MHLHYPFIQKNIRKHFRFLCKSKKGKFGYIKAEVFTTDSPHGLQLRLFFFAFQFLIDKLCGVELSGIIFWLSSTYASGFGGFNLTAMAKYSLNISIRYIKIMIEIENK